MQRVTERRQGKAMYLEGCRGEENAVDALMLKSVLVGAEGGG